MDNRTLEEKTYQQQTDNMIFQAVSQILYERVDLYDWYIWLVEGETNDDQRED